MRVLLTGATGFVGSHILKALLERGHAVCIVKRNRSDLKRVQEYLPYCTTYNLEEADIKEILTKNKVECIVHCAAYYGRADKEHAQNVEANIVFPLQILYAGLESGVEYFINTDTFFTKQMEKPAGPREKMYMQGYSLSKYQFRQWGRMAAGEGINFVNMKLEHVYGEHDNKDKFIPCIVKSCRENAGAVALSQGKQKRDFIYVKDVADAYCKVLDSFELSPNEPPGKYMEYEVGTGRMRSVREFVELIHSTLGSRSILEWGRVPMKEGELMESKADITKLKEIGWEPKVVEDAEIKGVFAKMVEVYDE